MIKTIQRGGTVTEQIDFVQEQCCKCGIPFYMPTYHRNGLINNPGQSFYCPNGHGQHYAGKTEAEKLKDELQSFKERTSKRQEELENMLLDKINENKKLSNQIKRTHAGVCPCCNRTFKQLAAHMKSKHPEYSKP